MKNERDTLGNVFNSKSNELDVLIRESDTEKQTRFLNDQVKQLKEQIKTLQDQEKEDDLVSTKKNEEILLLEDKYRVLIEKTGYDAEQGKVVPRTKWDPKKKKGPQKRVLNLDWDKNKSETLDEEERKPIQV